MAENEDSTNDDQGSSSDVTAGDAAGKTGSDSAGTANPTNATAPNAPTAPVLVTSPVTTSYYDLMKAVVDDPSLNGDEKLEILRELERICPSDDRFTYRIAIGLLGAVALLSLIAIWALAQFRGGELPQGLIAIASGAVGGLAGLLSPSKSAGTSTP